MEWTELIANVGFPIGVSMYLLQCIETRLDRVIQLLDRMDSWQHSESSKMKGA